MNTSVTVYGYIPFPSNHEQQQYRTILRSVKKVGPQLGTWVILLANFNYQHTTLQAIENDYDWVGQFDVVLVAPNHIVIYEMKAKPARVRGRTDQRDWELLYRGTTEPVRERSYFDQISKQRVYFLREFLEKSRQSIGVDEELHFDVDARLVFPRVSELHVYHKVPIDTNRSEFETKTLPSVADPDLRKLLRAAYQPRDESDDRLYLSLRLDRETAELIKKALNSSATPVKTEMWFSAITTTEVRQDLIDNCGSSRMLLSEETGHAIARQLSLPVVEQEIA